MDGIKNTKTCQYCGEPLHRTDVIFCSRACSGKAHVKPKNRYVRKCATCGNQLQSNQQKYCSPSCQVRGRTSSIALICECCHKEFYRCRANVHNGLQFCSVDCKHRYWKNMRLHTNGKSLLCTRCSQYKPFAAFKKSKSHNIGYKSWCNACLAEKRKSERATNPEYAARRRAASIANYAKRKARKLQTSYADVAAEDIINMPAQQNYKCWWCGKDIRKKYHIDHVIPLSRGGTHTKDNLRATCPTCNLSKNDKTPYEFAGRMF